MYIHICNLISFSSCAVRLRASDTPYAMAEWRARERERGRPTDKQEKNERDGDIRPDPKPKPLQLRDGEMAHLLFAASCGLALTPHIQHLFLLLCIHGLEWIYYSVYYMAMAALCVAMPMAIRRRAMAPKRNAPSEFAEETENDADAKLQWLLDFFFNYGLRLEISKLR